MNAGLSHLARKLSAYEGFANDDLNGLCRLAPERLSFSSGAVLNEAGTRFKRTYLICSGWAVHHRDLNDGGRQVINFLIPGDFACLNATLFSSSSRSVAAITNLDVLAFRPDLLFDVFTGDRRLSKILHWITTQELSVVSEHLTNVGRRTAYERMAHLLLEMWCRLDRIDLTDGMRFDLPITLGLFADSLGLTSIHISRTAQRLRDDKLFDIEFGIKRKVHILDKHAASVAAQFDSSYLKFGDVFKP